MTRVLVAFVLALVLTACGGGGGGGGGGGAPIGGGGSNNGGSGGDNGGSGGDDGGSGGDDGGSGGDDGGSGGDDGGSGGDDGGSGGDDGGSGGDDGGSGGDDGGSGGDDGGSGGDDGGSGGDDGDPEEPQNASTGGIWQGELESGEAVIGMVTEDGEFHFIVTEDELTLTQYFGSFTANGNDVTADFTGYASLLTDFGDGSTAGTGTLTGTVQERSTLSLDVAFETSAGTAFTDSATLTYNSALYETESSLEKIAGNYFDIRLNTVVNINSDGEIFAQSASFGCVMNGTVSIIDTQYNLYRVEYTFSNCEEDAAVLNDLEFSGLGFIDPESDPPNGVLIGATAETEDGGASLVTWLLRI